MEISEKRPFACELCELRFTTKQFLQRHYIVHTEDRNYKCHLCSNSYKYKKGLNRHYKKAHYPHYKKEISCNSAIKHKPVSENTEKPKKSEKANENPKLANDLSRIVLLDITKIILTSPFPVP